MQILDGRGRAFNLQSAIGARQSRLTPLARSTTIRPPSGEQGGVRPRGGGGNHGSLRQARGRATGGVGNPGGGARPGRLRQGRTGAGSEAGPAGGRRRPRTRPRRRPATPGYTSPSPRPPSPSRRPTGGRLPDQTLTGKSVGKLYTEVVRQWDSIRFDDADGQAARTTATPRHRAGPDRDRAAARLAPQPRPQLRRPGPGRLLRRPGVRARPSTRSRTSRPGDQARPGRGRLPAGHRRAGLRQHRLLAQARVQRQDAAPRGGHRRRLPRRGAGHRPRAGSTSRCARRRYLDGNYTVFGKVTRGLDVARKIFTQPVVADDRGPRGRPPPEKPVVIRKVTSRPRVETARWPNA